MTVTSCYWNQLYRYLSFYRCSSEPIEVNINCWRSLSTLVKILLLMQEMLNTLVCSFVSVALSMIIYCRIKFHTGKIFKNTPHPPYIIGNNNNSTGTSGIAFVLNVRYISKLLNCWKHIEVNCGIYSFLENKYASQPWYWWVINLSILELNFSD